VEMPPLSLCCAQQGAWRAAGPSCIKRSPLRAAVRKRRPSPTVAHSTKSHLTPAGLRGFSYLMSQGATMKFLALSCLTLFGYFGDVYCGTVGMNSNSNKNAIKTLEPVSPSPPRTAASESLVHKVPPVDTSQVIKPCSNDAF